MVVVVVMVVVVALNEPMWVGTGSCHVSCLPRLTENNCGARHDRVELEPQLMPPLRTRRAEENLSVPRVGRTNRCDELREGAAQ